MLGCASGWGMEWKRRSHAQLPAEEEARTKAEPQAKAEPQSEAAECRHGGSKERDEVVLIWAEAQQAAHGDHEAVEQERNAAQGVVPAPALDEHARGDNKDNGGVRGVSAPQYRRVTTSSRIPVAPGQRAKAHEEAGAHEEGCSRRYCLRSFSKLLLHAAPVACDCSSFIAFRVFSVLTVYAAPARPELWGWTDRRQGPTASLPTAYVGPSQRQCPGLIRSQGQRQAGSSILDRR